MRILIADDNEWVRRGVKGILSSDTNCEVCGEAVDGAAAIRMARQLLPDIILLDISMPGLDGLEAARLLQRESSKLKIIIMSQHDPILLGPQVIRAGAQACIDKNRLDIDLLVTINAVLRSETDRAIKTQ